MQGRYGGILFVLLFVWAAVSSGFLGYALYHKTLRMDVFAGRVNQDGVRDLSALPLVKKRVTILHFNDIYELGQLGDRGGLSRAIYQKELYENANPGNTIAVFSGDLLSPSAMSTALLDEKGSSLNGIQMVNVTNLLFDIATFGNHEFDLKPLVLRQRLQESNYPWIASNVMSDFFPPSKTPPFVVKMLGGIKIGFISAVIDTITPPYVQILGIRETVDRLKKELIPHLREQLGVEFVVALTHLAWVDDIRLIQEEIGIDLVLGGHDHENMLYRVSNDLVPLAKADSNTRSFYVHEIYSNPKYSKRGSSSTEPPFVIRSELKPVTKDLPTNAEADRLIQYWWSQAHTSFLRQGFDLDSIVTTLPEGITWDARNHVIRQGTNDLTFVVGESMQYCAAKKYQYALDGAIYNVGMLRVDDIMDSGEISTYDVLRVLPFLDMLCVVRVRGDILLKVFDKSRTYNVWLGGFIQLSHHFSAGCMEVLSEDRKWDKRQECTLNGSPIRKNKMYTLATSQYLVSGQEINLSFFNAATNPSVELVWKTQDDFRKCFIDYLEDRGPLFRP